MKPSRTLPVAEIVSLNEEILSLDPQALRPLDLEARLELAVATVTSVDRLCCLCEAFSCNEFAGCPPEGDLG